VNRITFKIPKYLATFKRFDRLIVQAFDSNFEQQFPELKVKSDS